MAGVTMVWGVVVVIEIAAETFCLEAKLLVEYNCRVVNCDMKGDVLAHTCLYEVVQHERANATPSPIWVHQEEGDVGFVHTHIWDEESAAHSKLPKQRHHCEVRIFKAFCHIHTSPEKVCYERIHSGYMVWAQIAVSDGWLSGRNAVQGRAPGGEGGMIVGLDFGQKLHLLRLGLMVCPNYWLQYAHGVGTNKGLPLVAASTDGALKSRECWWEG